MSKRGTHILSGPDTARYGCIVSFEASDGKRLTLHQTGPTLKALRWCCMTALAQDETFKVVAYSTPATIFSDLAGRASAGKQSAPELAMTRRVGFHDICHPRLA